MFKSLAKKILLLFSFLAAGFNLQAESVFTYNLKKDIVIGALSIGMFITPFFINSEQGDIPANLNRNDVNIFDRGLMFPHHETLDNIKIIFLAGALISPLAIPLAGSIRSKDTWLTYGIMYTQALLFTLGARGILKSLIYRYRPYAYFDGMPAGRDFHRSFPSGTAALVFFPATFLSVTFAAEFPNSPWKIPIIAGSHVLAAGVGATRILSGTHFLSDVLVGAAIGSFFGWVIPALHKRVNNENGVISHFAGNGKVIRLRF